MDYDAVTLDTNIFDENRLNLEGGMLQQLLQFKQGLTQFVLSEIVIREIHRHLSDQAQKAKDALGSAIQKSAESGLLAGQAVADLQAVHAGLVAPREAAKARLARFLDGSGCEIIPANEADMKRLIAMYFEPGAPFEGTGKKKNEFPDAIALITLEDWAKNHNKKILAISADKGWAKFAETSDRIDIEPDLAAALQRLQDDADQASEFVAGLLRSMDAGEESELLKELKTRIERQVGDLSPLAEGSASYYFESELTHITFHEVQFLREDDGYDLYIVQIGKDKIVARIGVQIKAEAEAHFDFQIHDEGDYIPMGDCDAQTEVEFDAGVLVTFEGDFSDSTPEFEITDVELVDAPDTVDFGNVGPDFSSDDYRE
jgi:hypothetical protein